MGVGRVTLCADHLLTCPRGIFLTHLGAPSPLLPTSRIREILFLVSSLFMPSSHFHPIDSMRHCWEICRESLLPAKSLPRIKVFSIPNESGSPNFRSGQVHSTFCFAPASNPPPVPVFLSHESYLCWTGGGVWTCFDRSLPMALGLTLNDTRLVSLKAELFLNVFWGSARANSLGGLKPPKI